MIKKFLVYAKNRCSYSRVFMLFLLLAISPKFLDARVPVGGQRKVAAPRPQPAQQPQPQIQQQPPRQPQPQPQVAAQQQAQLLEQEQAQQRAQELARQRQAQQQAQELARQREAEAQRLQQQARDIAAQEQAQQRARDQLARQQQQAQQREEEAEARRQEVQRRAAEENARFLAEQQARLAQQQPVLQPQLAPERQVFGQLLRDVGFFDLSDAEVNFLFDANLGDADRAVASIVDAGGIDDWRQARGGQDTGLTERERQRMLREREREERQQREREEEQRREVQRVEEERIEKETLEKEKKAAAETMMDYDAELRDIEDTIARLEQEIANDTKAAESLTVKSSSSGTDPIKALQDELTELDKTIPDLEAQIQQMGGSSRLVTQGPKQALTSKLSSTGKTTKSSVTQATQQQPRQQPQRGLANLGLNNASGSDCFLSASIQILTQIQPFIERLVEIKRNGNATPAQKEFLALVASLRGRQDPDAVNMYNPANDAAKVFRNFITQAQFGLILNGLGPKTRRMVAGQGLGKPTYECTGNALPTSQRNERNGQPLENTLFCYEQQDAQEFLSSLLNLLIGNDQNLDIFSITLRTRLTDAFGGNVRLATEYKENIGEVVKEEKQQVLFLSPVSKVGQALHQNFNQCLASNFNPENLPYGGTIQPILQAPLPEIMIIGFSRFKFGSLNDKWEHGIKFPITIEKAIFEQYMQQQGNGKKYELFGILIHDKVGIKTKDGAVVYGGHYRAYTKERAGGQWRHFNDSQVSDVTEQQIQAIANQTSEIGKPYLLFYRSVDGN